MALSPQLPRTPVVAVATVSYGSGDVLEGFLESVPTSSAGPVVIRGTKLRGRKKMMVER